MIIVGYQGIGKSTIVKNIYAPDSIDLESGNFWVDGKRAEDWYKPYCKIAVHLSEQGYVVFTSSHEVVRNYLKEISSEPVVIVHPALELKDDWINKLEERYNQTKLDKDYKALMNAKDRYSENISELMNSGLCTKEIDSMDYSLQEIVENLLVDYSLAIRDTEWEHADYTALEKYIPKVDLWIEKTNEEFHKLMK